MIDFNITLNVGSTRIRLRDIDYMYIYIYVSLGCPFNLKLYTLCLTRDFKTIITAGHILSAEGELLIS